MLAVLVMWLTLTPGRDVVVQPYTGKVVRQALYRVADKAGYEPLLRLLEDRGQYKPYSTTPLLRGGRPLIKARPGPPLTLRAGEEYSFRLSLFLDDMGAARLPLLFPAAIDLYDSAPSLVKLRRAAVYTEETIRLPLARGSRVALDFLTPTQLQLPKINKRAKRGRYVMLPQPHLLFYGLRELWNRYADEKITSAPWRANYALLNTYLDVHSSAITYDEHRMLVGFTGRAVYKVETRSTRLLDALSKTLALASLIGVGKSRGIGLGYVKVSVKQPPGRGRRVRRSKPL